MHIRKHFILLNFFTWTIVLLFDLAGDYFYELFWDRPFYWLEEIPFITSWYIWFFLTPVAVYLCRRYRYDKIKVLKFIVYHFTVYLLLNAIQVVLAFGYITILGNWILGKSAYTRVFYKTAISGCFYNFTIYVIIVLVINGLKYYNDLQQEKNKTYLLEKRLTESRMQFLKQQLQPHFLFNTHHSIITLMKTGFIEKAVEMMEKLSDLMRFALRENTSQEVTLEKELQLLQLYIDIQKIRFEDKLLVIYNVAKDVVKALVPSMLLQPFMENAIKYAVENSAHETKITITAKKLDEDLLVCIKDERISSTSLLEIKKGIGINNTEERLKQLYGRNHHFELKPFKNHTNNGLEVIIKIPLHYA